MNPEAQDKTPLTQMLRRCIDAQQLFPNKDMRKEDFMKGRPGTGYIASLVVFRVGVLWAGVLLTAAVEAQARSQEAKKFQSSSSTTGSRGSTPEAAAA